MTSVPGSAICGTVSICCGRWRLSAGMLCWDGTTGRCGRSIGPRYRHGDAGFGGRGSSAGAAGYGCCGLLSADTAACVAAGTSPLAPVLNTGRKSAGHDGVADLGERRVGIEFRAGTAILGKADSEVFPQRGQVDGRRGPPPLLVLAG